MELTVTPQMDGLPLLRVLTQAADVPPWAVKAALKRRDVRVDGVRTADGTMRVRAGQQIRAFWPKEAVAGKVGVLPPIVYEDAHVLLLNKPQGLPAQNDTDPQAGDSALTRAAAYLRERGGEAMLCHRLDVQTGGLLLLAKDAQTYEAALEAFAAHAVEKQYTCRVKGCPARQEGMMRAYLRKDAQLARVSVTDAPVPGALPIVTGYRVVEAGEQARLLVDLYTGRTHQIRAHLAHIGHPILGDDKYGDRALNRALGIRRQQLWATRLVLHAGGVLSYLDGRAFTVECPF